MGRPRTEQKYPAVATAAVALAVTKGYRKAAKETGLSTATVQSLVKRCNADVNSIKKNLAEGFADMADASLTHASAGLHDLSASQAMVCAGIAADKMLALLGQAPGQAINVQAIVAQLSDLDTLKAELAKRASVVTVVEPIPATDTLNQ